jgi:hypothetical protein
MRKEMQKNADLTWAQRPTFNLLVAESYSVFKEFTRPFSIILCVFQHVSLLYALENNKAFTPLENFFAHQLNPK